MLTAKILLNNMKHESTRERAGQGDSCSFKFAVSLVLLGEL